MTSCVVNGQEIHHPLLRALVICTAILFALALAPCLALLIVPILGLTGLLVTGVLGLVALVVLLVLLSVPVVVVGGLLLGLLWLPFAFLKAVWRALF